VLRGIFADDTHPAQEPAEIYFDPLGLAMRSIGPLHRVEILAVKNDRCDWVQ